MPTKDKTCNACGKPFKVNTDRNPDRNVCAKCWNKGRR